MTAPGYFTQQQQNRAIADQWRRFEADRLARQNRVQSGSVSVQNNPPPTRVEQSQQAQPSQPWAKYGITEDQYWKVIRDNVGRAGSGMQNPWAANFDITKPISSTNKKTWDQAFREEAQRSKGQQPNPLTGSFDLDPYIRQGGDVIYRPHSPGVDVLAQQLVRVIPNFQHYSSFDDKFHHNLYKQKGQDSQHRYGLALDLAIDGGRKDYAAAKVALIQYMNKLQIPASDYYVQDEANNPSSNATAPHLHFEFTSAAAAKRFREMFPNSPLSKYAQK